MRWWTPLCRVCEPGKQENDFFIRQLVYVLCRVFQSHRNIPPIYAVQSDGCRPFGGGFLFAFRPAEAGTTRRASAGLPVDQASGSG